MTMIYGIRLWFFVLYLGASLAFLAATIRFRARRDAIEKQKGPLPTPGMLIGIGVPLLILLARAGEILTEGLLIRFVGIGLSLYTLAILPWAMQTLGQMAAPGVGVFEDHELITSGPYRFLRHPGYSATLALWLGAALGTLNWLLLVLWPLMVILLFMVGIRPEEALLHEKFESDYEEYTQQTSRLIPGIW